MTPPKQTKLQKQLVSILPSELNDSQNDYSYSYTEQDMDCSYNSAIQHMKRNIHRLRVNKTPLVNILVQSKYTDNMKVSDYGKLADQIIKGIELEVEE